MATPRDLFGDVKSHDVGQQFANALSKGIPASDILGEIAQGPTGKFIGDVRVLDFLNQEAQRQRAPRPTEPGIPQGSATGHFDRQRSNGLKEIGCE